MLRCDAALGYLNYTSFPKPVSEDRHDKAKSENEDVSCPSTKVVAIKQKVVLGLL